MCTCSCVDRHVCSCKGLFSSNLLLTPHTHTHAHQNCNVNKNIVTKALSLSLSLSVCVGRNSTGNISLLFYSFIFSAILWLVSSAAVGIRPNLAMNDIYFIHYRLTSEHQAQQKGEWCHTKLFQGLVCTVSCVGVCADVCVLLICFMCVGVCVKVGLWRGCLLKPDLCVCVSLFTSIELFVCSDFFFIKVYGWRFMMMGQW